MYGYRLDRDVELVTLRVRALVRTPPPRLERVRTRPLAPTAVLGERRLTLDGRAVRARVVDRAALTPGQAFEGPAVVQEYTGPTLVPPRVRAAVAWGGHLMLEG
mgnify:CR=1 FL=1